MIATQARRWRGVLVAGAVLGLHAERPLARLVGKPIRVRVREGCGSEVGLD
jgi:hypothetical protein